MIRWLEELIAAIQTGSGGVNVRKKTQVYLLLHLTLCLSDPPRVVRGHRVVHSGHFWVSSQKATCSESHQPKGPLYPNKKRQPLLCNTLMLLLLSLTVIAQEKTRGGGGAMPGENDLDRGLKGRVKKKGKRWCWMIRCCPRAAPSRFLYFVYFHLALHSLLHRGHTAYSSMTSLTTPTISLNHIDGSDAPASQTLTHMHAAALLPLFGLVSCAWCVDVISKALPVSQTWPIAGITQCAQLSSGQDHLSRPATLTLLFDPWVSSPHRIIRDVRAHAAMKIDRKQWKTRLCLDMGFPIFISSVWTLADVIY